MCARRVRQSEIFIVKKRLVPFWIRECKKFFRERKKKQSNLRLKRLITKKYVIATCNSGNGLTVDFMWRI